MNMQMIVFLVGNLLQILSLWPMRKLPAVESLQAPQSPQIWRHLKRAWDCQSFRYLCCYSWSLSIANGMTQSAFFHFHYQVLELSLFKMFLLLNAMHLVKIPLSELAGRWIDRYGARRLLWVSLMMAAAGMPIWLIVTAKTWWLLFAVYALWGCYAIANIAQLQLAWKYSPQSDNQTELGLFRQIGGLFAGLAGFLGGLWMSRFSFPSETLTEAAMGIIVSSFVLRLLAPQWLLLVNEQSNNHSKG